MTIQKVGFELEVQLGKSLDTVHSFGTNSLLALSESSIAFNLLEP